MSESIASYRSGTSGFSGFSSVAGGDIHNDGLEELAFAGDFHRLRNEAEDLMNEAFVAIQEFRLDEEVAVAALFGFLEWAQLALFLLSPEWGYGFRWDAGPWRWVRRLQLQVPVADQGHAFWTGVFFALGGILAFIVAGAVFIATRRRTRKAPDAFIIVLRVICTVFLGVFNVSAFSCLMMAVACNWGRRGTDDGTLMFWPEKKCISEGHAVQGAFAIFLFIPAWLLMSSIYAVSLPLPSPRSKLLSATPDSFATLRSLLLRSAFAGSYYIFAPGGQLKLLSLIFLLLSLLMAMNLTLKGCHFSLPFRAARSGGAGAIFFGSLVTVFRVHHENRWVRQDSLALAVGSPLFGLLTAALSYLLWRRDARTANAVLAETRAAQRIDPGITAAALRLDMQFSSPEQVHRAAAVIARLAPTGKPIPPEIPFAVEAAFLQGIRQFPESALLHVLAARFAMDLAEAPAVVEGGPAGEADAQARQAASVPAWAVTQVERAKALQPEWPERYLIFAADAELKELSQRDAASEETAMDLQGYVDFQNDFAKVVKAHRSALLVTRRFWRLLCKEHIAFFEIDRAAHDMQRYEMLAERSYRAALEKRPQNVKLLRAFARFIDEVLHDPFRAQQVRGEAEKRERAAEAKTRRTSVNKGGVDERVDAVVVATAQGVIKIANKNLHKLFGYKKDELPGKNISILMPPPYNQLHAGYVKRYLQTQKSTVMDATRRLEGKHKSGRLIPITIRVTRIESAGEVSFLGVIRAVQEEHAECVVSLEDGTMLEANDALAEIFGYSGGRELVDNSVAALLQPEAEEDLRAAIILAASGEAVDHLFAGYHASGAAVPVSLQLGPGDAEGSIRIRFTSLTGSGLLTTDDMGNIRSCNALVSRLFGHPNNVLTKMNLTGLMPKPFSRFHNTYLNRYREFRSYGKGTSLGIVGNPLGHIVPGLHKNGTIFWCRLDVHEIPDDNGRITYTGKLTIETAAGSPQDARAFLLTLHAPYRGTNPSAELGSSGFTVAGASDHIDLLAGCHASDITDLPLAKVLQSPTKGDWELGDALRALCGPAEEIPTDATPFLRAQFVRPDGTRLEVALGRPQAADAFNPEEPTTLHVQVWALQRVEGIVEITGDGIVTSVSMGALITLGFHEDELVGESVNRIMPPAVAAHHDAFLTKARGQRIVTSRRIVDVRHRDGSTVRILLEVSDADKGRPGNPMYVARISSRASEQPTPLPPVVAGSLSAATHRPSSFEQDRPAGPASGERLRQAHFERVGHGTTLESDGEGALPRRDRSVKAAAEPGFVPRTGPSALQRRASMMPKRGSNANLPVAGAWTKPGKRPSAGQMSALVGVPSQDDLRNVPGAANEGGPPAPAERAAKERDTKVLWVGLESSALQQRARRVSVNQQGPIVLSTDDDADNGGASGQRRPRLSRGANLGSGVWSYNNIAALEPEGAEGGAGSPDALATDGGTTPATSHVRRFRASQGSVRSAGRHAAGGPQGRPESPSRLSVSDGGSSDDGPDDRLAPAAGLPSAHVSNKRRPVKVAAMDSGHSHAPVNDFLLERFQQDAMQAAETFRERRESTTRHHHSRRDHHQAAASPANDAQQRSTAMTGSEFGEDNAVVPVNDKQLLARTASGEVQALSAPMENCEVPPEDAMSPENVAEKRAKRTRGILRLLNSPRMRAAISDLTKQTRVIFVLCSGAYVSAIAVVNILIGEHIIKMQQIMDVCEAVIQGVDCGAAARTLQQLTLLPEPNQIGDETIPEQPEYLEERPDRLIELMDGLYSAANDNSGPAAGLAPPRGQVASAFQSIWTYKSFEIPSDGSPGAYVQTPLTAFDGASLLAAQARGIAAQGRAERDLPLLADNPVYMFLIDNSGTAFASSFLAIQAAEKEEAVALLGRAAYLQLVLLIVNIVVFILSILYFRHLLARVAVERVSLYSIFLRAPKNVVLKLATENVRVRMDDSDDSEDEADHDGDDEDDDWTQRILLEQQAKKRQQEIAKAKEEAAAAKQQQQPQHSNSVGGGGAGLGAEENGGGSGEADGAHKSDSVAHAGGDAPPAASKAPLLLEPAMKKGLLHPHIATRQQQPGGSQQAAKGGGDGKQAGGGKAAAGSGGVKKSTKRRLQERGAAAYYFLLPLIVWGAVTISGFAASYSLLSTTISYVHQIRAAAISWQLAARIHFYAQELIALPKGSPPAAYDDVKRNLLAVIQDFETYYDATLYGDAAMSVEPSLLVNDARDHLLWLETACIAKHCDAEIGHPWFPRIASGLDTLLYFYIQAATRMLDQEPEELTVDNPFFNFLWETGTHDVNDGLDKFTHLFNEDTHENPAAAQTILISMFCAVIVAVLLFVFYSFIPWTKRIVSESTRVAHLLAELPTEMDIDSLVLQNAPSAGGSKQGKGAWKI